MVGGEPESRTIDSLKREDGMSVSGLNGLAQSRANAALQLLRASGEDGASTGDADAPGLIQPNRGSKPAQSAAQTIRAILENQAAAVSAPKARPRVALDLSPEAYNRPATVEEFERLAEILLEPGDSIELMIGAQTYGVEGAAKLSDEELRFAVDILSSNIQHKENRIENMEAGIREGAARPDASKQQRIIAEALDNGTLEIVPLDEFGVTFSTVHTIAVSQIGWSAFSNGYESSFSELVELNARMRVEQDDGTYIDPESGKYVSYVFTNGQGFFLMADGPQNAASAA